MEKSCLKGCFCLKAGFTLIELLVVVLIIGILAAVALPQYQKAVEKSRMTEVIINLKAFGDAAEVCKLRKGENCGMPELDIVPSHATYLDNEGPYFETDGFAYRLYGEDVNGNKMKGYIESHEDDLCICYLNNGQFVLSQNSGCVAPAKFDYASLLNLPDIGAGACACC